MTIICADLAGRGACPGGAPEGAPPALQAFIRSALLWIPHENARGKGWALLGAVGKLKVNYRFCSMGWGRLAWWRGTFCISKEEACGQD